jgi:hypothetical protein
VWDGDFVMMDYEMKGFAFAIWVWTAENGTAFDSLPR